MLNVARGLGALLMAPAGTGDLTGRPAHPPVLPATPAYRPQGERRSLGESDYIHLLDGAHHLLKAPLIMVWDRLSTHASKTMKARIAGREWLSVVLLPGHAPELNPVEGLGAHIKRSLANLAARTLSELETLLRRRSRRCSTGTASSADSSAGRASLSTDRTDGPRQRPPGHRLAGRRTSSPSGSRTHWPPRPGGSDRVRPAGRRGEAATRGRRGRGMLRRRRPRSSRGGTRVRAPPDWWPRPGRRRWRCPARSRVGVRWT
ncbi:transposase [Streptomyces avermitilis]